MRNSTVTLAVTTASPERNSPSEASRRLGVKALDVFGRRLRRLHKEPMATLARDGAVVKP